MYQCKLCEYSTKYWYPPTSPHAVTTQKTINKVVLGSNATESFSHTECQLEMNEKL
jgi:hypothetical protein